MLGAIAIIALLATVGMFYLNGRYRTVVGWWKEMAIDIAGAVFGTIGIVTVCAAGMNAGNGPFVLAIVIAYGAVMISGGILAEGWGIKHLTHRPSK